MYTALLTLIPLFVIWDAQSATTLKWLLIPRDVGVPLFLSGYLILIWIERIWGKRLSDGMIADDPRLALKRFNFGLIVARIFIPVWFTCGVFWMGWGNPVLGPIARWKVSTPAILLGIAPCLIAWMGLWWAQFPVDRAVRESNVVSQLESDLPVFSPVDFSKYFSQKLRSQLLFVLVPWIAIQLLHDACCIVLGHVAHASLGPAWLTDAWVIGWGDSAASLASFLLIVLISPELLRRVLWTAPLGDMQLRQGLTEICRRSGIGCRDILLWRTHNNMANAAMMGVVPWTRYVILSDLLLETMTDQQIRAVFAHEIGHVKHRHIMWFAVFLISFNGALLALFLRVERYLSLSESKAQVYEIASVLAAVSITWLFFCTLSRWFERQADVFAARALQGVLSPVDAENKHMGADIFASALRRVAVVNNIPERAWNWTHPSIAARVRFIRQFGRDPQVAEQFDRTGRRVFWMLSVLIVVCTIIAMYGAFR